MIPEWIRDKVGVNLSEHQLAALFNTVSSIKAEQVCVLRALERAKRVTDSTPNGNSEADSKSTSIDRSGEDIPSDVHLPLNEHQDSAHDPSIPHSHGDVVNQDSPYDSALSTSHDRDDTKSDHHNPSARKHGRRIKTPVLIAHGTSDQTVAFRHSRLLASALAEYFEHFGMDSAEMIDVFVHDGGHVRAYESDDYHVRLVEFFRKQLG